METITINDKNEILITTSSGSFEILVGGNTDLYWRPIVEGNLYTSEESVEIIIEESDTFVYPYIEQVYNNIMYCNPYNKDKVNTRDKNDEYLIDKRREYPLREEKTIVWRSNESILDTASILRISKENKMYKIKFIKGLVGNFMYTYAINFCSSGCIYDSYYIPFYEMYKDMCESLKIKEKIKE